VTPEAEQRNRAAVAELSDALRQELRAELTPADAPDWLLMAQAGRA
jgi:hypothetical protein